MLSQLIQRLCQARSQRRLFTDDKGAIAASLVEIGVAMLAVGILTAGAFTSFTGFIDSASDSTARGRVTDAASVADQVYNWLRPGGARCYDDTDCSAVTNTTAAEALQEAAGGQLTFAAWDKTFPTAGTIYVEVDGSTHADDNKATAATGDHNGIAGDPANGQWIRLAIKSDSGATFCVIKVAHTDDPVYEGAGYMSVNSADSEESGKSAHCGGHEGESGGSSQAPITATSCVYGYEGESVLQGTATAQGVTTAATACHTDRSLGRPGAGHDVDG